MTRARSKSGNYDTEIDGLKDILSKLNDNVGSLNVSMAINTEATEGLSRAVEKDSARTSANMTALENRNSVTETRVDEIDIKMAGMSHTEANIVNLQNKVEALQKIVVHNRATMARCAEVAETVKKHQEWIDIFRGKISGLTISGAIVSILCLPVAGWFLLAVAHYVFQTPPHP